MTVTTIVLIIGFSTLLLSDFAPNFQMGALAAVMIGLAWVADFVVTTALLSYGRERRERARGPTRTDPQVDGSGRLTLHPETRGPERPFKEPKMNTKQPLFAALAARGARPPRRRPGRPRPTSRSPRQPAFDTADAAAYGQASWPTTQDLYGQGWRDEVNQRRP